MLGHGVDQLQVAFGQASRRALLDVQHSQHPAVCFDGHGQFGLGVWQERVGDEENNLVHLVGEEGFAGFSRVADDARSRLKPLVL